MLRDLFGRRKYYKEYMARKRQEGKFVNKLDREQSERVRVRNRMMRWIEHGRVKVDEKYQLYLKKELTYKDYPATIQEIPMFVEKFYTKFPEYKSRYGATKELFIENMLHEMFTKFIYKNGGRRKFALRYNDGSIATTIDWRVR